MIWILRIFVALALSWIAIDKTDGFSLSLIEGPLPLKKMDQIDWDEASIDRALSQTFHYLGKGRQSFVFESEDGKWVLKFFNQKYFKNPWYVKFEWPFFSKQRKQEISKRAQRREFYLNSYRIAARELKDETGIAYLHLALGNKTLPKVLFFDKANRKFQLDLNETPFVLQKRGIPFYTALDEVFAVEGEAGLHRFLDSFVESIADRISLKIGDADQDIEHNWAVCGDQVFHLDPGRFFIDEDLFNPSKLKAEWWRATHCLVKWLKRHYPSADLYLRQKIEANIVETTMRPNWQQSATFQPPRTDGMLRERFRVS